MNRSLGVCAMYLSDWQYIIKDVLHSKLTKKEIRQLVIGYCLSSPEKLFGSYQVNDQNVYDLIVCKDVNCQKRMKELHINSLTGIEGYYEEIKYQQMRGTYPRSRRFRKR